MERFNKGANMKKKNTRPPCPLGGDNNDCENCVYYPDYKWSDEVEECQEQKETDGVE